MDRKKQLSDANKLTDISYNQTVSFLEEIVADNSLASSLLNWRPKKLLLNGLIETIKYYKKFN